MKKNEIKKLDSLKVGKFTAYYKFEYFRENMCFHLLGIENEFNDFMFKDVYISKMKNLYLYLIELKALSMDKTFIITWINRDIFDDGKVKEKDLEGYPFKFKLFDDDNVHYFTGYSAVDNTELAFNPLDEYGSNYGCTYIEYWNPIKKVWEML